MTWLKAVHCRELLKKIGDGGDSLGKESQMFQDIFGPFVTEKKAKEMYLELHNDSKSHPGKTDDAP